MADETHQDCSGHIHISRELWRARREGRLTMATFEALLAEHLRGLCSVCASEFAAGQEPARTYDDLFERLEARGQVLERRVEHERAVALEDFETLVKLSPEERLSRIGGDERRFSSPLLVERLLQESASALPSDPDGSLHFATLAEAITSLYPRPEAAPTVIRALTYKGNALRAKGCHSEAVHCFRLARKLLQEGVPVEGDRSVAVVDVEVAALLDLCYGTYFKTIRDFPEAEACLNRAALLYGVAGKRTSLHQVVLTLAELYAKIGRTTDAIDAVGRVLANLADDDHPELYWMARFNLSGYLIEAEIYDEARIELSACAKASLFVENDFYQYRLRWNQGRLALGIGDFGRAAEELSAVRARYLEEGNGINTALVSLDLSIAYLKAGRVSDVKRIADELVQIFNAQDIHREALAALILFQEAAFHEQLTLRRIQRFRQYLQESRHNPELVFEAVS